LSYDAHIGNKASSTYTDVQNLYFHHIPVLWLNLDYTDQPIWHYFKKNRRHFSQDCWVCTWLFSGWSQ